MSQENVANSAHEIGTLTLTILKITENTSIAQQQVLDIGEYHVLSIRRKILA
jgi:hypothetical protein